MKITPAAGHLGAVVTDIDLRHASDGDMDQIRALIDEHLVLAFPDQGAMTDEDQVAFTLGFGEPYVHPIGRSRGATFGCAHIVDDVDHPPFQDHWHTDVSWDPEPPSFGTLRMLQRPDRGGDTVFASMYAAYDALSEPLRTMLDGLHAVHTMGIGAAFRSKAGDASVDATLAQFGGTTHPVVKTHPVSGRRYLNVNKAFTDHIVELSPDESRAVLDLLYLHCTNPNFQLRWSWTEGDLILWDERPTLHFAVADYWPQRREVARVNVR